jgi:hypothetical protein
VLIVLCLSLLLELMSLLFLGWLFLGSSLVQPGGRQANRGTPATRLPTAAQGALPKALNSAQSAVQTVLQLLSPSRSCAIPEAPVSPAKNPTAWARLASNRYI